LFQFDCSLSLYFPPPKPPSRPSSPSIPA
jgi:hypothetical protein